VYGERKRNFLGQNLWARGVVVSTVRRDEALVRQQRKFDPRRYAELTPLLTEEKRLSQMNLWQ